MSEDYKISETDWKRWVHLSGDALARYQENTLLQAAKLVKGPGTPDERYRKLSKLLAQSDDTIAAVFDAQKRTRAVVQIAAALDEGIVSEDELRAFSEETRESVAAYRAK